MASAAFTIEGGSSPQTVSAGATVNLALSSTTGVRTVTWSIIGGSDSTKTAPTITTAGDPDGATASFTMNTPVGSVGLTWLVQCKINGGVDDEGRTVSAYTATGIVGVVNSSAILPFALGEKFERHATYGIIDDINSLFIGIGADATSLRGVTLELATVGSPNSGDIIYYNGSQYVAGAPTAITLTWAQVLADGAVSGGTNPRISTGDNLEFVDANTYIDADATGLHFVIPAADDFTFTDGAMTLTAGTSGFALAFTTAASGNGVDVSTNAQHGSATGNGANVTVEAGSSSAEGATYGSGAVSFAYGATHGAGTHTSGGWEFSSGALVGTGVNGTVGDVLFETGAILDATGTTTAGNIIQNVKNANADTLGQHLFRFDGDRLFAIADGYVEHGETAGDTVATTGEYRVGQEWEVQGWSGAANRRVLRWSVTDGAHLTVGDANITRVIVTGGAGTSGGLRVFGGATQVAEFDDTGFYAADTGGTIITGSSSLVTVSAGALAIGSTVSDNGTIRVPFGGSLRSRNTGNTGNLPMIETSGADNVSVGHPSLINDLSLNAGTGVMRGNVGGTAVWITRTTEFELQATMKLDWASGTAALSIGGTNWLSDNGSTTILEHSVLLNAAFISIGSTVSAPIWGQLDDATASATGDTFINRAQSVTGTGTCVGGAYTQYAGNATGAGTANTGGTFMSRGGDASNAAANTGGDWWARPGNGSTAGGELYLAKGNGSKMLRIDDTGWAVFGVNPVAQPSSTGEATGFTAGSGTGVNDDSTFTGNDGTKAYRVNDIVKHLKATGILAKS